ncbi:MAG: hypothetical protein E5X69_29130, partial [Mesorhizobium sp.]
MQLLSTDYLDFRKALPPSETALVAVWRHLDRVSEADSVVSRRAGVSVTDIVARLAKGTDRRVLTDVNEFTRVFLNHLNDARGDAATFWKTIGSFDRRPGLFAVDGQHRNVVAVQNYMSAAKRDALVNELIAKLLSDPFSTDDGLEAFQIKVVELAAFAVREVCEV